MILQLKKKILFFFSILECFIIVVSKITRKFILNNESQKKGPLKKYSQMKSPWKKSVWDKNSMKKRDCVGSSGGIKR